MANAMYDTPEDVARWREWRRQHVGASEAAAVCGLSPYSTALAVWLDKVQPVEPTEPTERQRWGLLLEPAIAQGYELQTGHKLMVPDRAVHPKYPFMAATGDRYADDGYDGRLVQIKNVGRDDGQWGEPGSDEIPRHYLLQCQHEMSVYGVDRCDLAALFGGNELRIYAIRYDPQLAEDLAGILGSFWGLVESRTPPEPDWLHPTTPALIDRLHRPRAGVEVELSEDLLGYVQDYEIHGRHIKNLDRARAADKARLIAAMGDAQRARCAGYTLSRTERERRGYEVKATTYTDFRVKPPKSQEIEL